MTIEYRFSLTPRLIALGMFASVALLVLLFALGYMVGQRMAPEPQQDAQSADGRLGRATDKAEQRMLNKAEQSAVGAAAPLTAPLKATSKALQ